MSLACTQKGRDKSELLSPNEHDLPSHLLSPGVGMTAWPQKAEELHLCEQGFPFLYHPGRASTIMKARPSGKKSGHGDGDQVPQNRKRSGRWILRLLP